MNFTIFLLLISQVLIQAGRSHTVWHVGHSHGSAHESAQQDRMIDARHQQVIWASWDADGHAHDPNLPDHSHVPKVEPAQRSCRTQSIGLDFVAPSAFAELAQCIVSFHIAERTARPEHSFRAFRPPPLSGRSTHLLF